MNTTTTTPSIEELTASVSTAHDAVALINALRARFEIHGYTLPEDGITARLRETLQNDLGADDETTDAFLARYRTALEAAVLTPSGPTPLDSEFDDTCAHALHERLDRLAHAALVPAAGRGRFRAVLLGGPQRTPVAFSAVTATPTEAFQWAAARVGRNSASLGTAGIGAQLVATQAQEEAGEAVDVEVVDFIVEAREHGTRTFRPLEELMR